jgi:hypothetical protein
VSLAPGESVAAGLDADGVTAAALAALGVPAEPGGVR